MGYNKYKGALFFTINIGVGFSYFLIRIGIGGDFTNPLEVLIPLTLGTILYFICVKE